MFAHFGPSFPAGISRLKATPMSSAKPAMQAKTMSRAFADGAADGARGAADLAAQLSRRRRDAEPT